MTGLPRRLWRPVADATAFLITLTAIGWALNVPGYFNVGFYPQQFLAVILGLALLLAFLTLPARKRSDDDPREIVPWWDAAMGVAAAASSLFIAVRFAGLVNLLYSQPAAMWIPGIIVMLLLLEALRRAAGPALVVIVVIFLLYGLFGDALPGRLQGRAQDWQLLAAYMSFDSNGILGIPMSVASTVVIAFIFFGVLLNVAGGSNFFTDAALMGMGRFRGGSMKIAVLASGLFGSISGSAVANVVGTGVVTIPMIKRDGYPGHKAGGIEAVASTGGQLMPPVMGAAAFLMAEFLAVPYSSVVSAALLPAVLYYVAVFIQADLEAARLGIRAIPKSQLPPGREVLRGLHFLLGFAVLIYALFGLRWQPERAALLGAASIFLTSMVFGYREGRLSPMAGFRSIARTGQAVTEIILISAASGIVIGVLNVTGLSFNLTYVLVQIGGDSLALLLVLSALVCIVLGMGLPTLGVYVLLAALVAPALVELGIDPIAAHLYVLYFGMMSMITPPIALAAFAAAAIAKAPAMATGLAAMRFGWLAYVIPVLFVFSPSLLLNGELGQIALAIVTAVVGVWLISAALAGYLAQRLTPLMRVVFAVFGMLALIPSDMLRNGIVTDVVGVLGGVALLIFAMRRRSPAAV